MLKKTAFLVSLSLFPWLSASAQTCDPNTPPDI